MLETFTIENRNSYLLYNDEIAKERGIDIFHRCIHDNDPKTFIFVFFHHSDLIKGHDNIEMHFMLFNDNPNFIEARERLKKDIKNIILIDRSIEDHRQEIIDAISKFLGGK